jgi:integrase
MPSMPRPRPPYLVSQTTRHGHTVWYVRRWHAQRIRIRSEYGSQAFWSEYRAAVEGAPAPNHEATAKTNTLAWGLKLYRNSSAWGALSNATRKQSENIYRSAGKTAGGSLLRDITSETIMAGRERRAATPHAANNFLKAMRRFFKWAAGDGKLVKLNPTLGVKLLQGKNKDGFHTWTDEEIDRYQRYWPIGTRERLALDLLLYTGLARGDVVRLGKQHASNGVITFRMEKNRGDGYVYPPLLQVLAETIAGSKTGDLTFLVTEKGLPFVKEGFGNWFRDACRAAGCPGSAHGLRKAGATRAAENGATVHQLMALFGWKTEKMALVYTRKADRKRLASSAGQLLVRTENENRPHLGSGEGAISNVQVKSGG